MDRTNDDISNFILPDFDKKSKAGKPPKPPKKVLVEKTELPRVNRTVSCIYCNAEKILNPDQYQRLFDLYESDEKVKEEFFCKPCEMTMKKNPFQFWSKHGETLHVLSKTLKDSFEEFRNSSKTTNDAIILQNNCGRILQENKISVDNVEFLLDSGIPYGLKIKNLPFVGQVVIRVYEQRSNRISIG